MMKRIFALFLAASITVTCMGTSLSAFADDAGKQENKTVSSKTETAAKEDKKQTLTTGSGYYYYLIKHSKAEKIYERLDIDLKSADLDGSRLENYNGEEAVVIDQSGKATFHFKVSRSGYYQINSRYAAVVGKPINMQLCVYIDGKVPYTEATTITFPRIWKDKYAADENGNFPKKDDNGNQLTPDTEEIVRYTDYVFHDNDYMTDADLLFYLEEGAHTLTLESSRESIALSQLWLGCRAENKTYDEYIADYKDAKIYSGDVIETAAEISSEHSEQSLTMVADYSNASTTPADPYTVCLNTIGGENWDDPGQWISWKIKVPEDALYALSFKYRQDYVSGFKVYRQVSVDGAVPFAEMENVPFAPCSNWENYTVSNSDDKPYYIYLTAGVEHRLTLKASLGPVAESLQILSNNVAKLNSIYRQIIGVTGDSPDANRDYNIDRAIPNLMEDFKSVYDDLCKIGEDIVRYNEVEGGLSSFIDVLTTQLEKFIEDPLEIPDGLAGFKSNISSLADMMTDMKSQAMLLDQIYLGGENSLPSPKVNIFKSVWFGLKGFFLSFVSNYDAIGNDYSKTDATYRIDEPVEVWMTSGRDQMNVLKTIIDDEFVAKYNIPVNLSLVDTGAALTKAILAGTGPDCALWLTDDVPITYTMRGALENLEQFNADNQYDKDGNKKYTYTFDEVYDWFYPSAFISLRYLDGNVYALPETQTFRMMFIRDDVFEELGLEIPKTWEDIYSCATVLQRNNMQIGIPSTDWNMFATLLLQNDNSMYIDDFSRTNLATVEAIDAFTQWTDFNAKYSLPLAYDALNRFRSGEIPIFLENYTFYNNLEIGAPEIKGLWSMHTLPGTVKDDGSISTSQVSAGTACVMIGGCDNKEAVWEFMSWWVSEKIQGSFGQKIEARLGAGGRFATANSAAFDHIPWSVDQQTSLRNAWESVSGIPKVPGDYYVTRMINNAFRAVVYNGTNTREALLKYSKEIDKEIQRKREEYNIDRYFKDGNK